MYFDLGADLRAGRNYNNIIQQQNNNNTNNSTIKDTTNDYTQSETSTTTEDTNKKQDSYNENSFTSFTETAYKQTMPLTELQDKLVSFNILEYSNAGSYGENYGSVRLTKKGHDIYRATHSLENPLEKIGFPIEDVGITKEYVVASLEISEKTEILTPLQNHMGVIVQKVYHSDGTTESIIIGKLISDVGTKSGIPGISSPMNDILTDKQMNNPSKTQYIVAVIPPRSIKENEYEIIEDATNHYITPKTESVLQVMEQESLSYRSYPYNIDGYTYDDLYELYLYELNQRNNNENT